MKLRFLTSLALVPALYAASQDSSAKGKAEYLAKDEFSKAMYMRKEKQGVVKELNKVVISTPVVKSDMSFYQGNYVSDDSGYALEIRQDVQNQMVATISQGSLKTALKNISIKDAYFSALKTNIDGTEEKWEGAFINKSGNGTTDFRLGIKLPHHLRKEGLKITKLFFKKISS